MPDNGPNPAAAGMGMGMGIDPWSIGQQAAGQVLGGGMGLIFGGIERKNQYKQAKKLQALQIEGQKEMGNYNLQKQLELWEQTGYGAQMRQMKEAGLNPALMYGMGGGGGITAAANPGTVSSEHSTTGQSIQGMGLMGNLALTQAQIENIKAQTQKTLAEIPNVSKTGAQIEAQTTNIKAVTDKVIAETQNEQSRNALIKLQTDMQQFQLDFANATAENEKELLNQAVQRNKIQLHILENDQTISNETLQTVIKQASADLWNTYADTALKRSNIKVNDAQIKLMKEQANGIIAGIVQRGLEIDIQQGTLDYNKQLADFETSFGGQAAQALKTVVEAIPNTKWKSRKPIGYGRK